MNSSLEKDSQKKMLSSLEFSGPNPNKLDTN